MFLFVGLPGEWKEVSFGTESLVQPFLCGSSITVSHTAGIVAPVSKTITYETTNIPSETTKCWITQNLGASHTATAVDDTSESSAGWYWQLSNDPCNLELGNNWRIPTFSEWINAYNAGGWHTSSEPWNSSLKLHLAGCLQYEGGLLRYRGTFGAQV